MSDFYYVKPEDAPCKTYRHAKDELRGISEILLGMPNGSPPVVIAPENVPLWRNRIWYLLSTSLTVELEEKDLEDVLRGVITAREARLRVIERCFSYLNQLRESDPVGKFHKSDQLARITVARVEAQLAAKSQADTTAKTDATHTTPGDEQFYTETPAPIAANCTLEEVVDALSSLHRVFVGDVHSGQVPQRCAETNKDLWRDRIIALTTAMVVADGDLDLKETALRLAFFSLLMLRQRDPVDTFLTNREKWTKLAEEGKF